MDGDYDNPSRWSPQEWSFLVAWEDFKNDVYNIRTNRPGVVPVPKSQHVFNGWEFGVDEYIGKKNALGDTMVKQGTDIKVILLNESEFENVGGLYLTITSKDKSHIEAFMKDFVGVISSRLSAADIEADCPVVVPE